MLAVAKKLRRKSSLISEYSFLAYLVRFGLPGRFQPEICDPAQNRNAKPQSRPSRRRFRGNLLRSRLQLSGYPISAGGEAIGVSAHQKDEMLDRRHAGR
jgi:hypothetical protein